MTKKISDLNIYLVGGAVRDKLLNIDRSDKDWVVVGASEEIMLSLGFRPVGKGFPVFLHPETHEEYALARTEKKVGRGYKGFSVDSSEVITLEQDLYRRDLTINAMALDHQDNLIDPFNGKRDLENGLLRHVSSHFSEDPLRVLRAARFAARYYSRGFIIHDSTLELMSDLSKSGELGYLVADRVWQEVRSALSETHPSVFFNVLRICGALVILFPEVDELFNRESDKTNVLSKIDVAAKLTDDVEIRFAVLAYLMSQAHPVADKDAKAASSVLRFCNRLKTSAQFRNLAVQVAKYTDQIYSADAHSAEDVVELVIALNGLRNEIGFERILNASLVLLTVVHGSKSKPKQAIALMRKFQKSMKQTDVKSLAGQYEGSELRKKVRSAYKKSVSKLLTDSNATESPE